MSTHRLDAWADGRRMGTLAYHDDTGRFALGQIWGTWDSKIKMKKIEVISGKAGNKKASISAGFSVT